MRLMWEPSTGFRPEMSSRRKTPKANTSVFSSTMPCVKYSGARHLSSHTHSSKAHGRPEQRKKRREWLQAVMYSWWR
uniref:Uncharacterized protein n=1 Tax=Zea mays TaxID=4577 RepID=A0A804M953_MAIZE